MTVLNHPRFRLYMAISLDGYIASPDGSVHWLEAYNPFEVGFGEFLACVGAIVMGRKSYDQMLTFGPAPWDRKRTIVMTRRPLPDPPPAIAASAEPVDMIANRLAAETQDGDVWVFGGGQVARAFLAAQRMHTVELCVVPHVIGQGIPLFGVGTRPSNLRLTRLRQFPKGLVCLDYDVLR